MTEKGSESRVARRLFLARLGSGVSILGVGAAAVPSVAAQSGANEKWQPARHELDDWYDKVPGKHRFVFDTITPDGLSMGLQFANNFFEANKNSYRLTDTDSAIVV